MLIFKIAFKNVFAHKAKTILIGFLLSVAMVVMIVGNSLMDTAKQASESAWIDCFAGDLMISPDYDQDFSMMGFINGGSTEKITEVAPYQDIVQVLRNHPSVQAFSPQVYSWQRLEFGVKDKYSGAVAFGIHPSSWATTFPQATTWLEGGPLQDGQEGIVISADIIKQVREVLKIPVEIGTKVTLTNPGWGAGGLSELPLVGIYKMNTGNRFFQMSAFIDLKNSRKLAGFGQKDPLTSTNAADRSLSDSLSTNDNIDDLFDDMSITETEGVSIDALAFSESEIAAMDARANAGVPGIEDGAFHYLLVRLKSGANAGQVQAELNTAIKALNPKMEVGNWYQSSGGFVHMTEIVRLIFIILVILLCLVTVFVITNALLISVAERTVEIGTMRALGGQRSFISRVFITESMILSAGFGSIGIFLSLIVLAILNHTGIYFADGFVAAMFGSAQLNPALSWFSIVAAMVILMLVGVVASLYPVRQAMKLAPTQAMGR